MHPSILVVPTGLADKMAKDHPIVMYFNFVGVVDGQTVRILKNRFENKKEIPLFGLGDYLKKITDISNSDAQVETIKMYKKGSFKYCVTQDRAINCGMSFDTEEGAKEFLKELKYMDVIANFMATFGKNPDGSRKEE